MGGLGSIPTEGNIFHWIFLFSRSKASDANIAIIAILVHFETNSALRSKNKKFFFIILGDVSYFCDTTGTIVLEIW